MWAPTYQGLARLAPGRASEPTWQGTVMSRFPPAAGLTRGGPTRARRSTAKDAATERASTASGATGSPWRPWH